MPGGRTTAPSVPATGGGRPPRRSTMKSLLALSESGLARRRKRIASPRGDQAARKTSRPGEDPDSPPPDPWTASRERHDRASRSCARRSRGSSSQSETTLGSERQPRAPILPHVHKTCTHRQSRLHGRVHVSQTTREARLRPSDGPARRKDLSRRGRFTRPRWRTCSGTPVAACAGVSLRQPQVPPGYLNETFRLNHRDDELPRFRTMLRKAAAS